MPTEMSQGEMLKGFSYALHWMRINGTLAQGKVLDGLYDTYPGENGDTILVVRSDYRSLLFREKTREHLSGILSLIRDGITGIEAINAALAGDSPNTMVSGTL